MHQEHLLKPVAALGAAQTLAWASSYYLPAMLAAPMAADLGLSTTMVYAAFSAALLVSAMVGPWAGGAIDRHGGRPLLMGTNLLFALGLGALAWAQGPLTLLAAWLLIGIAMGGGLYEAAFSTLVRLYGSDSRRAITGITLIAGLASTVGWPLSALMQSHFGWRGTCLGWAALHLLIGLPLNAMLPTPAPPGPPSEAPSESLSEPILPARPVLTSALLAFVFAATWFISTAMASHLPRLLQASGVSLAIAVGIGALVGPAQVVARVLEFSLLRRVHPLLAARLAALAHPVGAAILWVVGAPGAALFAMLHGGGNGILTIAKGTLPLVLFGPVGYGARQGWLMVPSRLAQASAPLLFGMAIDRWGVRAIGLSAAIGLAAFLALMLLPAKSTR